MGAHLGAQGWMGETEFQLAKFGPYVTALQIAVVAAACFLASFRFEIHLLYSKLTTLCRVLQYTLVLTEGSDMGL